MPYSKYRGVKICFYSCRYQNQNFSLVSHSCRSCSTRVALLLFVWHWCCSCVALVSFVSHSCRTRVAFVSLVLYNYELILTEAQRCSLKRVFLEISQNSQENTCARAFLFHKVAGVRPVWKYPLRKTRYFQKWHCLGIRRCVEIFHPTTIYYVV